MILVIQTVSQEFTKNGAEYRKITGVTDKGQQTTKSVFNNLEAKWEMLRENATVELKLEQKGQFWNVVDILPVSVPEERPPIKPEPQEDEPSLGDIEPPYPKPFKSDATTTDKPKFQGDARQHDIHRQVALKCAVELASHGLIKLSELKSTSKMSLEYRDGE